MIFVTVGTSSWDFSRLIAEMDRIACELNEDVVMQIGHSSYTPKNTRYFRIAPSRIIYDLFSASRIVVSHAGVGCILSASKFKKPLVIIPRRSIFNEHFDDHQLEIANALNCNPNITVVMEITDLKNVLLNQLEMFPCRSSTNAMVLRLKKYINSL